MSKTNDTSNLGHGTLEDHGALADSELDAVTGGGVLRGSQGDRKGGRYQRNSRDSRSALDARRAGGGRYTCFAERCEI